KKEVTGANVLVAIFGEKESHAVYFLNQRGVTRLDVVNYIAHGITKTSPKKDEKQESAKEEADGEQQPAGALDAYTVNLNQLTNNPKSILFIDEIHTIIGAGAASGGTLDASNLLKPALNTGALKCIGATTYNEYRVIFEKDHALSRRFQKIDVPEPSIAETIEILKGLKTRFEQHHGVKYAPAALTTAAELSARFINDRHLPDKAIDVIDEAGAAQKILPKSR